MGWYKGSASSGGESQNVHDYVYDYTDWFGPRMLDEYIVNDSDSNWHVNATFLADGDNEYLSIILSVIDDTYFDTVMEDINITINDLIPQDTVVRYSWVIPSGYKCLITGIVGG